MIGTSRGEIEKAVVLRLRVELGNEVQVDSFPDGDLKKYVLSAAKSACLVRYAGSRSVEPMSEDYIRQEQAVAVEILILTRNLRRHNQDVRDGLYDLLDGIERSLVGYAAQSETGERLTGKFFSVSDEPVEFDGDGLFAHLALYAAPRLIIQN